MTVLALDTASTVDRSKIVSPATSAPARFGGAEHRHVERGAGCASASGVIDTVGAETFTKSVTVPGISGAGRLNMS